MKMIFDNNTLNDNSTIIGENITNNYYSKLDKNEYKKIIERCYNNCYELKIYSQKDELYKLALYGLNQYDWNIEEKQHLLTIIADTSKNLREKIEYYKGASDIAPNTVLGKTAYNFWKKCNILLTVREIFTF